VIENWVAKIAKYKEIEGIIDLFDRIKFKNGILRRSSLVF
jgi:hypothetical protein